ncbi:MAG: relaxase/mobilization nuclease domain-containing protein [Anaerolineaceae bacterium]|nr:relaxase/mobilization nuclease domain-containing protein [Anaerolineaceae bacterium]
MAVLKHLSSKSADYSKALEYLIFQHDERTQQPILNDKGQMILRDEFYLDGLNCHPYSFDKECVQLNDRFHKNQNYNEIKSHHYILSFDPRDKEDSGLTGEHAQALGLEFANRFFAGHQALVCTHMDGHNGSGNIHVHIVINSLRKLDVERQDFMERPCDYRAGYKHHQTRDYLTAMQKGLMKITERENLHQVDLISPAPVKITEREYWKNRREQEKLDRLNSQIVADGMKPRFTNYQTQKQFIRDAVTDIATHACSFDVFKTALFKKYGISVKSSRGRFSYLHPEREKYITARKLGAAFEQDYLLSLFAENEKAGRQQPAEPEVSPDKEITEANQLLTNMSPKEYDPSYDYHADPIAILYIRSNLRLVVDLQTNIKAQQSRAYARKVRISNLQEMARTVCYVQEHGYASRDDLNKAYESVI